MTSSQWQGCHSSELVKKHIYCPRTSTLRDDFSRYGIAAYIIDTWSQATNDSNSLWKAADFLLALLCPYPVSWCSASVLVFYLTTSSHCIIRWLRAVCRRMSWELTLRLLVHCAGTVTGLQRSVAQPTAVLLTDRDGGIGWNAETTYIRGWNSSTKIFNIG